MAALIKAVISGTVEDVGKYLSWPSVIRPSLYQLNPLVLACLRGDESIVKFLLTSDSFQSDDVDSSLIMASEAGNEGIVRLLLESGASANLTWREQRPLHTASVLGHVGVVKVLLEYGASVAAELAEPPLFIYNQLKDLLKRHGLRLYDIQYVGNLFRRSQTALDLASLLGHVDIVKILLDNAAIPWCHSPRALHLASVGRKYSPLVTSQPNAISHEQVVRILLDKGYDVESVLEGETPLCCAAKCGSVNVVKVLLEAGADANVVASAEMMPIHFALKAADNQMEIIKMLLAHGASNHSENSRRLTVLHFAAKYECVEAIKFFLERGEDPNSRDTDFETPLHKILGSPEGAEVLLSYGAQIDAICSDGSTPLTRACYRRNREMVKLLLEKGASVNFQHCGGVLSKTPLSSAMSIAETYDDKCMNRYARADPYMRLYPGFKTPLFCAVQNVFQCDSSLDIVDLLVSYGADVNLVDPRGRTLIDVMISYVLSCSENRLALLEHRAHYYSGEYLENGMVLALLDYGAHYSGKYIEKGMVSAQLRLYAVKLEVAELPLTCDLTDRFIKDARIAVGKQGIEKFRKEVEKIKQNNISDSNVSLHNLLKRRQPVYRGQFAEAVRSLLNGPISLSAEYPNYWRLLKANFLRGLKRGQLIDDGYIVIERVPDVTIPREAIDAIFSYLGDRDLTNLRHVLFP